MQTTDHSRSPAVRAIRFALAGLILAGAIYLVIRLTGNDHPAEQAAGGHDHAAMLAAGSGDEAHPVTLTPDMARRIGVTYAEATIGPLTREIRVVGQVVPDESRIDAITSKVDGWVEALSLTTTGQPVTRGQVVLQVYSPTLLQMQEELLLALRLQRDMRSRGAGSENGSDLVEAARHRLRLLDVSDAEIQAIEAEGKPRRSLTIYSGISGNVLEKNVLVGQRIMAGEALYRVADLGSVWLEGEVFEQDLGAVAPGQMVHADFPALPDEHRMGKIAFIYPTLSPTTRTARVRVILPNQDLHLKPGMYATLRIEGRELSRVLTVPRDAVLSTGDRSVVFTLAENGSLVPREVAVGTSNSTRVEILRGLSEGEVVVASATFLIDAESNLGKEMGGMGDMPGMDMNTPVQKLPMQETGRKQPDPHAGHGSPAAPVTGKPGN